MTHHNDSSWTGTVAADTFNYTQAVEPNVTVVSETNATPFSHLTSQAIAHKRMKSKVKVIRRAS